MTLPLHKKPELSPERKALLQRLLKQQGITSSEPEKKPVQRGDDGSAPLSFAQQRVWFLHQLEPASSNFHMLSSLRLLGTLRVDALEASLNELISRHEILRTTFPIRVGSPVQQVGPVFSLPITPTNLLHLAEAEQKQEIIRAIQKDKQQPYDLEHGPLLRVYLFQKSAEEHILLLSLHHIISDAWSMGILSRELSTLYDAFVNGKPSPLPTLSNQYADFALWQRERLQGRVLEEQLAYWTRQLADKPSPLALPTDHPRLARQSYRGHTYTFALPASLSQKLSELCQREGVTLVMLMLATFQLLLCRYAGQEDISVGLPVANRTRVEFENLVGNFVNTLVMRTNMQGNPTFRELLQRVRANSLEAYSRQDVPFEQVVEALRPERDPSRTVLFQALFALQNAYREQELTGLTCLPFEVEDNVLYGE
ncbi:MAG TPA: condensation domain-containing protein [Ktedonobacteraceae bacterium]|nr:condensation domain-containing protein [Ktedonobacteraceae bacterium]